MFGNLEKENTASFTATCVSFSSRALGSFLPSNTSVAIFAIGIPVAFAIKGTVLLALGLTSNMYISPSCIAYCILINPLTCSASAIFFCLLCYSICYF